MNDIFYLFAVLYIIKEANNLYYFLFKKRKSGVNLPKEPMELMSEGYRAFKNSFKITPEKIISFLFLVWIITGIILTNESWWFSLLLIINIILEVLLFIKSCFDGYKIMQGGEIDDKSFMDLSVWHHVVKYSINIFIAFYILYYHFF